MSNIALFSTISTQKDIFITFFAKILAKTLVFFVISAYFCARIEKIFGYIRFITSEKHLAASNTSDLILFHFKSASVYWKDPSQYVEP